MSDDKNRGIYGKFNIRRTDGKSMPGEKHHGCKYFVLDVTHDPYAVAALQAYAKACSEDYPKLSEDVEAMAQNSVVGRSLLI